jgi:hypothetical protein
LLGDGGNVLKTTINIATDVFNRIVAAAVIQGISRSDMINYLIKKVMDDIPEPVRLGTMVQYQARRAPACWHVFHLQLREDDYEYFLDLRKLLKMSVSCILSYAVKKFLKRPIGKINIDNYTFRNYLVIKEVVSGIICWKFLWGCPPNLENLVPL